MNTITNQLDQTMLSMLVASMDVAELLQPPRVTKMASTMGLRVGWGVDLTTNDTDGRAWNINVPEMRNRVARKVLNDKPMLSIGSPMCTIDSVTDDANHSRMPTEVVQARFDHARKHSEFAAKFY